MPLSRSICLCGAGGVRATYPEGGCVLTCIECKREASGATNDEALENWNRQNAAREEKSDRVEEEE
jgi:hypothetical protein